MYIFNTQLVHHSHSQFGDLGSTHLGRTGAASSSPRSEKSETLSSESSTYWDQGGGRGEEKGEVREEGGRGQEEGGVREEGGLRRRGYICRMSLQGGGMSEKLSTISFPN